MKTRVIKGWRLHTTEPEKVSTPTKKPEYDFKPLEDVVRLWAKSAR